MTRDDDWDAIVAKLPGDWRELAPLHGVLKSKNPAASALASGWKVRDPRVLLRMILRYTCTNIQCFQPSRALAHRAGGASLAPPLKGGPSRTTSTSGCGSTS